MVGLQFNVKAVKEVVADGDMHCLLFKTKCRGYKQMVWLAKEFMDKVEVADAYHRFAKHTLYLGLYG